MDYPGEEMKWNKVGRIFAAEGQFDWMCSHTACPVPYQIGDNLHRIFFGTRNAKGCPSIGSLVVNLDNPQEVLDLSASPHLSNGPRGFFDDNGVYPGPVVKIDSNDYMYYMGRSNGEAGLYYMSIGLARLDADGNISRIYGAPVLGRSEHDPWMTSTPCVMKQGELYRMWYLSGLGWESESVSKYHIKYAESVDGVNWVREGRVAIDFNPGETNIASPAVWIEGGKYFMIFCVSSSGEENSKGYGLEYAESADGYTWERKGYVDISGGVDESWDSVSQAYPYVFVNKNKIYLLYSGNFNGKSGFGIAVKDYGV